MDGDCGVQYSLGWIILHACNKNSQRSTSSCSLPLSYPFRGNTQFWHLSVSADEAVHGSKERVLFRHWWSGDEYWTRSKAGQKMGKGQSNWRRPSPPFAPLFSPFSPAAKSTVHIQCHLGFPHPPLPYPMAHMSRFFAFTRLFRSVGVHSPSIFQPPPI